MARYPDRFRVYQIGFSLYERAWTLRGIENLLIDFHDHPDFVRGLFRALSDYNIAQVGRALEFEIDAVCFGDDWGQQHGLIMGPALWRRFIKPRIREMYGAVKSTNKFVIIHSCGDVKLVFPDLIECGLDCFNPFQPEVMDVCEMKRQFGDRLSFFGGISTQQTLPYGTVDDVRAEVQRNIEVVGKDGGYIAAPAHAIPGDAPPENIHAMLEVLQSQ